MSTPWATLTPSTGGGNDVDVDDNDDASASKDILISKDEFVVGRAKSCDYLLVGKKMISGKHFVIRRVDDGGGAELEDCSTNGTMLNNANLVKKTKVPLRDGDTINLVFGKAAQGQKHLGFVFHFTASTALNDDEDAEEEMEETQTLEEDCFSFTSPEAKQPSTAASSSGGPSSMKRAHEGDDDDDDDDDDGTNSRPKKKANKNDDAVNDANDVKKEDDDQMEENMMCCICQDILHDCVSVQPCMHCFCGGCYSTWMKRSKDCPQCRKSVQHVAKNHTVINLVNAYLKMHPEKMRDAEDLAALDKKNVVKDGKPINPVGGRGGGLFGLSNDSDSDGLPPDDDFDSPSDEDDDDEESSPQYSLRVGPPRVRCRQCGGAGSGGCGVDAGNASATNAPVPPPRHSYGTRRAAAASTSSDDGTATSTPLLGSSATSTNPTTSPPLPPDFRCEPQQLHISCQCCREHMPDRRFEPVSDAFPLNRRQICSLCSNAFCDAYFGCTRCDLGCLTMLKNARFTDNDMYGIVLGNHYETQVLTDYMTAKNISKEELFAKCVENLGNGRYSVPDNVSSSSLSSGVNFGASSSSSSTSVNSSSTNPRPSVFRFPGLVTSASDIHGDSLLCHSCALKVLKELVYQYREKDVDVADLPPAVVARQDCWWGRNCRTAVTRSAHAAKLNHICPQTRRA